MVDKGIIKKRISTIDSHFNRIEKYKKVSQDEFLANIEIQDAVEYNIFQIINHLIDLVQHISVDEEYGTPENAYNGAEFLFENKVFTKEDLNLIRKMIGLRNVIGHSYLSIDKLIVYKVLIEGIKDINTIISKIVSRFL